MSAFRDTVRLGECTWTDVQAALEAGTDTVVLPVASTEQHGPHLPLQTDAAIGGAIAERVARKLGDALVAPTVRPGVSGHHMDFPGSLTVDADLLMDLLVAHAESVAHHGFETLVLLPSHGGNFAPVNTVAPEIAREVDIDVVPLADLDGYMELMNEAMRETGLPEEDVVHAGGTETSAMLAIAPDLVREDEIPQGYEGELSVPALLSKGFRHFTENGVLGDARDSSAEAGEAILETVAAAYAERIEAEREN